MRDKIFRVENNENASACWTTTQFARIIDREGELNNARDPRYFSIGKRVSNAQFEALTSRTTMISKVQGGLNTAVLLAKGEISPQLAQEYASVDGLLMEIKDIKERNMNEIWHNASLQLGSIQTQHEETCFKNTQEPS